MDRIPDHVFHKHIWPRIDTLPAHKLALLRSVSKRWKSLFTNDIIWKDTWFQTTVAPPKSIWSHYIWLAGSVACSNPKCYNWQINYPDKAPPPSFRSHFTKTLQPMRFNVRTQVKSNYFKACFLWKRLRGNDRRLVPLLASREMDG